MTDMENIRRVATKCYYRLVQKETAKLEETNGEHGLKELERLDLYQLFRDKAYDKYGNGMFFEDFCDLFDSVYREVEEEKRWESLVLC